MRGAPWFLGLALQSLLFGARSLIGQSYSGRLPFLLLPFCRLPIGATFFPKQGIFQTSGAFSTVTNHSESKAYAP